MEIQIQLKALADKISTMKEQIQTEEATKNAFVMPFINILGYDIFNPTEVVPEFTADIGLKKGEKVDYAIFQNEQPIIIIECKHWKENLDIHNSQLFRYFHVSKSRFALLTNGIHFRFYTDLDETNKMDEKPFLEFNITTIKDSTISELNKFHKSNFDVDKIVDNASSLKHTKELRKCFSSELNTPSPEFVRLLTSKVYSGRLTEKVLDLFTELVTKAINQVVSDRVNDRLQNALNKEEEQQIEENSVIEPVSKIETTEEELEGYRIVVAILRRKLTIDRIVHRDTQSYFGILLDDNNRKPLCRLHLDGSKKYLGLFDSNKNENRIPINSVDEIYNHEAQLLATVDYYE